MRNVDYIIVGNGLAGIGLAGELWKLKQNVLMISSKTIPSSSTVAAGLYNPITGRKMTKTWLADTLFPLLTQTYQYWENVTKKRFLNKILIYRPFFTVEEQNEWQIKSSENIYKSYIQTLETQSVHDKINDKLGGITLKKSGYLDVNKYIDSVGSFLEQNGMTHIQHEFQYDAIEFKDNHVCYKDVCCKKIIFCQGVGNLSNPYFEYLPINRVKGEIIEICCDININFIINRGIFAIPLGHKKFKIGATYDNKDYSLKPTNAAKSIMSKKFEKLIIQEFTCNNQIVGIRPASKDRKPIIGLHPKFDGLAILNGLGSKGVSLSPYCAKQLANYLVHGMKIDSNIDIARFEEMYS